MTQAAATEGPDHGWSRSKAQSLRAVLDATDEAFRRGAPPNALIWPTGLVHLDRTLGGGIRSGELVLLAGTEGSGKTTLAIQLARNAVVSTGRPALVFSFEHESDTLMHRLLALEAAAAAERSGGDLEGAAGVHDVRGVFEAAAPDRGGLGAAMSHLPYGDAALASVEQYAPRFHLHTSTSHTTIEVMARIIRDVTAAEGHAPLVVLDYLQKVPDPQLGDETARVTRVTESLKDLALDLDVPVVAIVAADRESLGSGHRMRTKDLRGSSALAYEADVVLVLASKDAIVSREHLVYDLGAAQRFRSWAVVSVEKNRHGQGQVEFELRKDFAHGRFHPETQIVSERLIEERVVTT